MPNLVKSSVLDRLTARFGALRKLDRSQSLFELGQTGARIYLRYSKVHPRNQTFYGLRAEDLRTLEGHSSYLCFLWDGQIEPLIIPFAEYEDVFRSLTPGGDGQYKAQVYLQDSGTELYLAHAGRFNVESHLGWDEIEAATGPIRQDAQDFSHPQIQTFLGAIGVLTGHDVWVPQNDRGRLDWSLTTPFQCRDFLPSGFDGIRNILQEVDVVWIGRGSSDLKALFEIEHSTPIYSGLLRFNDIHLDMPNLRPRFSVVANDTRRSLFVRQLNRPTFRTSGLRELCTFLEYADVFGWYRRMWDRSHQGGIG